MRILFLTQIIPYPPDAGPRVKTLHVLRYLASRGHEVVLASFVRPEEMRFVPKLETLCSAVHTVPIRRSRLADIGYLLRSNLTGRPFLVERDGLSEMVSLVNRLLEARSFDVIHADQLTMAQFALPFASDRAAGHRSPALVFDAHNAVWTILERMRENAPWYLRPFAALEAGRIKRYEGMVIRSFDHTLAVTEPDREALFQAVAAAGGDARSQSRAKDSITVVPIAVDTQELQPLDRSPGSKNIFTLGSLHYPPNADGIRWFAREIFPLVRRRIPAATLTITGKSPPADFLEMQAEDPAAIHVTGYVEDLTPLMQAAGVMVVPVRAGGGMRVRILEAFARGMPVVTTTVGLEGIEAQPGRDVLVADTPETFAAEVARLLDDPQLQTDLARNGRRLAEKCYDWQVVLGKMDVIYSHHQELQPT